MVFSEDVVVDQADLKLGGVSLAEYAFKPDLPNGSANDGFVYDPATFTATWTLTAPINSDRLTLRLNADGSNPIVDGGGTRLDGNWTNPTSTTQPNSSDYPSGDGTAGGDFVFRFNVLPGDATQDDIVDLADLSKLLANYGQSGMTCAQGDFTGDGIVDLADLSKLLATYGKTLPSAPTVTNVLVCGSAWTSTYLSFLTAQNSRNVGGCSLPVGSGVQLLTVPWGSIDQIKVIFSENVVVDQADLLLSGVNTTEYNVSGGTFSYDSATFTATWTLPQTIGSDRLTLRLNADGSNPIVDGGGTRLDGNWTNPTSTTQPNSSDYPSGDGTAGGDFVFRFNVLPGDATQDDIVDLADLSKLLANYGQSGMTCAQGDFTGDGIVDLADLSKVLSNWGATMGSLFLPAGSTSVVAESSTAIQVSSVKSISVASNVAVVQPDAWSLSQADTVTIEHNPTSSIPVAQAESALVRHHAIKSDISAAVWLSNVRLHTAALRAAHDAVFNRLDNGTDDGLLENGATAFLRVAPVLRRLSPTRDNQPILKPGYHTFSSAHDMVATNDVPTELGD